MWAAGHELQGMAMQVANGAVNFALIRSKNEAGATLIEVLVAILLLSFGMLALGAMLSFAVQAPKMSAYRATATNLANSYVERMRANPEGFAKSDGTGGSYGTALNGAGSITTAAHPIAATRPARQPAWPPRISRTFESKQGGNCPRAMSS